MTDLSVNEIEPQTNDGTDLSTIVPTQATLTSEALDSRATKTDVALGAISPGYENVKTAISSGYEGQIRNHLAQIETSKRQLASSAALSDVVYNQPVDPNHPFDQEMLKQLQTGDKANPQTVIEDKFVHNSINGLMSIDQNNVTDTAQREQQGPTLDAYSRNTVLNQLAKTKLEDLNSQISAEGLGSWVGQEAKQMLPLGSWMNLSHAASTLTAGGGNEKLLDELSSIRDPNEYKAKLDEITNDLARGNPLDARDFLQTLVSHQYSSTDQLLTNLGGLTSVLGFEKNAPEELLAKGAKLATEVGSTDAAKAAISKGLPPDWTEAYVHPITGEEVLTKSAKETKKAVQDIAQSVDSSGLSMPEILNDGGHTNLAAEVQARQKLARDIFDDQALLHNPDEAARTEYLNLTKDLPGAFSPDAYSVGAEKFSATLANELVQQTRGNISKTVAIATNPMSVSTLTPEADQVAFEAARAAIHAQAGDFKLAILDMQPVLREQTATNTLKYNVQFGDTKGSVFRTEEDARQTALHQYNFTPGTFEIKQIGTGFHIQKYYDVAERGSDETNLAISLANEETNRATEWGGTVMDAIRYFAGDRATRAPFQNKQTGVLVNVAQRLEDLVKGLGQPIGDLYRSKEGLNDLGKILNINKVFETKTGDAYSRGMFYKNTGELADAYRTYIGRNPTEKEVKAYFAAVDISNGDWTIRSLATAAPKIRGGILNHTVDLMSGDGNKLPFQFEARVLDHIPSQEGPAQGFLKIDPQTGVGRYFNLKDLSPNEYLNLKDEIKRDGLKILNRGDVSDRGLNEYVQEQHPINFVLVKSSKEDNLRLDKQLNFSPGGHSEYTDKLFLKQPETIRNANGSLDYTGDKVLSSVRTQKEGQAMLSSLEKARNLYNGKNWSELERALKDTPWSVNTFKQLAQSFDMRNPFALVESNKPISGPGIKLSNGLSLQDTFQGIRDFTRNPYEPFAKSTVGFAGSKDPLLQTIVNKGTEQNPVWQMRNADLVNPFVTMQNSMREIVNHPMYAAYQDAAARQYVQQFGHMFTMDGKTGIGTQDLLRNPAFYLKNASISKDVPVGDKIRASYIKNGINNLLGTPSLTSKALNGFTNDLLNVAYTVGGDKGVSLIQKNILTPRMLSVVRNPQAYTRSVATHAWQGMFSPTPFFTQASAASYIPLISPKNGLTGSLAGTLMMKAMFTQEDHIFEHFAKWAADPTLQKAGMSGWSKAMLIDAYKSMRLTGFDHVGSGYIAQLSATDPMLFTNTLGQRFFDKSTMFLKGGEGVVKHSAWFTAYKDFTDLNPTKIGKMSRDDVQTILNRAQAMSHNMTRDATAFYQRGMLGAFGQFTNWSTRITELMLGGQLNQLERVRLIAGNQILYGSGIGAAAYMLSHGQGNPWDVVKSSTGSVNPFAEDIQSYAQKNNINLDTGMINAIYHGIFTQGLNMMIGHNVDFSSKWGYSGMNILDNYNKALKDTNPYFAPVVAAMGSSGQLISSIFNSATPVFSDLKQMLLQNPDGSKLLWGDIANASKNISAVNVAQKLIAVANSMNYRSGSGSLKIPGDTEDKAYEAFKAITGLSDIQDAEDWNKESILKDYQDKISQARKAINPDVGAWSDAWLKGDYKTSDALSRRIEATLLAFGLSSHDAMNLFKGMPENFQNTLHDSMIKRWDKYSVGQHPEQLLGGEQN